MKAPRLLPTVRHPRGDDGSMVLALATIGLVATFSIALLASVLGQENGVRRNQGFGFALQGADSGVQQAEFLQRSGQAAKIPSVRPAAAQLTVSGTEVRFWKATMSPTSMRLFGEGTAAGQKPRTVAVDLVESPLFPVAAFGATKVAFNGNNSADSYSADPSFPNGGRGYGLVGSNGTLELKNNSTIDAAVLYNYSLDPNPSRCQNGTCGTPTGEQHVGAALDVTSAFAADGFVTQHLNACKAAGPLTAFQAPSMTTTPTGYLTDPDGSKFVCYTSFFADSQSFVVSGPGSISVYVDGGTVTLGNKNHSDVNYTSATPDSTKLRIFSTGTKVDMYNQGQIATAVFAPRATCGGVTSNAGTDFYGSLVCDVIDNVGGWSFHYDTALLTLGDGKYVRSHYSEQ